MEIRHRFSCCMVLIVLFIFCTSTWHCFCRNSTLLCREEERLALLQFKQSLQSKPGLLQSWQMEDCCRWTGVACDPKTGHVTKLELLAPLYPEKPFSASELSPSISKLRYLTHLDLSGFKITNNTAIPKFMDSMKQLQYLNISNVGFTGIIPSYLGNLVHLEVLDLQEIGYSYSYGYYDHMLLIDPQWISSLKSLEYIDMSGLQLGKARDLIKVLGELPSLTHLILSYSGINTSHLSHFEGLQNHSSFANLQYLDLSNNEFQGQLPSNVFLPSLNYLDLSYNYFDSFENPFPLSPHLQHLDISFDQFQCEIQGALSMTSLTYLDLSHNYFTSIPMWFTGLWYLVYLDLGYNSLNHIEGGFLTLLSGKVYLRSLKVNNNHLLGQMSDGNSSAFCAFYLEEVDASGNSNLEGTLPNWLWMLKYLRYLSLSDNRLQGTIPESLSQLRSLQWLDLARNLLSGTINLQLSSLSMLNVLDLSSNNLVGMLPVELTDLINLRDLNLSCNHLSGNIPNKIGDMKWLESLDVSNNNLSGTIPQGILALTFLRYLNLSNNNFMGKIPKGNQLDALHQFDHSIYAGNPLLCGDPLQKKCQGDKEAEGDGSNSLDKIILYGAIFLGFMTGFWGVIGTLVLRNDWKTAYFRFIEESMDKVYVAVMVMVTKIKRWMNG